MNQELRAFVANRFDAVHSAKPVVNYPSWCTVDDASARPAATLGYRVASEGQLFLEAYLDQPIETIVSELFGTAVARGDIVEIGCLASTPTPALLKLWHDVAGRLQGTHEFAVATLTRPLRSMFARIGVPLVEIARADPARVTDVSAWGRYYELEPVVCAGSIELGAAALSAYAARSQRN